MAKPKKASKTAQYRVVDSDAASNLHRVGPAYGLIAVLLVIAGGSITNHFLRNLPDALSVADLEQSPEAVFIGERAWKDLRSFTELGPRTTGSRANDELAVGIFKREIAAIQEGKHPDQEVLMENQVVTGAFNFTFYGTSMTTVYRNVQNVVVKLVGKSEDAVLLNCHFDTVPGSPGSSDDVASCTVMLEILRVMSRLPGRNRNSVIFLFNGAEETLLQASHGFITQHPWAKQVKAFLNLESAGSGGKEVLFQSGPNAPWMVDVYARTVRHPFAQVMAEELFKTGLIPSDTDFRIFRDYGNIPGMDLAHFLNGFRYHTRYDSMEYLSVGVLQRTGDNVLALTRGMANSKHLSTSTDEGQGSSTVFFDFLGLFFVNYPARLGQLINAVVAFLAVLIPYRGLSQAVGNQRSNGAIWAEICYGFSAMGGGLLLSLATSAAISHQMLAMDNVMSWYSNSWLILGMYCAPAVVCHCLVQMFVNAYFKNPKSYLTTGMVTQARLIGVSAFWSICSLGLTLVGLRSGYIFMVLQLCTLAGTILNWIFRLQRTIRAWIAIHLIAQFIVVIWTSFYYIVFVNLFVPITGRAGSVINPDFIIGIVAALGVALCCSYLFPLMVLIRKPLRLMACFSAVGLMALILACFTPVGFPYRDASTGEPTSQRHLVTHTLRVFHDELGLLKHMDQGFLFEVQDRNADRMLRQFIAKEGSGFVPIQQMESCQTELFCALPLDAMWRQVHFDHFWQPTEAAPAMSNMFTLAYEGRENIRQGVQRINFKAEGSIQSAIFLGTKAGVRLIGWSLQDVVAPPVRFNGQEGHFVYISHGVPSGPWNITMDFEVQNEKHEGTIVELGVVTKFWDVPEMHTDEFNQFLATFPPWAHVVPSVAVVNMFEL
ncbi:conserved hypothetical protein [Culex quinquefasciatus]|uniref:FXNA-like protease n=1 Tax=Culex quinquefasciatus TaxID=7176 RepID=B0WS52_CULQU|nr:conserved hypothetical protein [Culex quinquefasciatus]|eukprot:XP_001851536.1 conserved hypothetical protein [Culex quinquefasciatus]